MESRSVRDIWGALGTFYGEFEDKELIEQLWQGYYDVTSGLFEKALDLRYSIGLANMPPYIKSRQEGFDINYGYLNSDYSGMVNTTTFSGYHAFYVDPGTISIPTLTYYYYDTNGDLSDKQTLVENTDYYIEDMNMIVFTPTGIIPFHPNYNQVHYSGNQLFADVIYQVNPYLWGVGIQRVGLNETDLRDLTYPAFIHLPSENATSIQQVEHFYYLMQALTDRLSKKGSISNIKSLYSLLRGLPFAHNSGIYDGFNASGLLYNPSIESLATLHFTGSGFSTPNSYPSIIDRNAFYSHEGTWEVSAKFDRTDLDQYLLGLNCSWSTSQQHLYIWWDQKEQEIVFEAKGEGNYAGGTPGMVVRYGAFDPTEWHQYRIYRNPTGPWECYIDNVLVGSGVVGFWENCFYSASGNKFVFGGKFTSNESTVIKVEKPFYGYMSKLHTVYDGFAAHTLKLELFPRTSGLELFNDDDGVGQNVGLVVSGSSLPNAYEWGVSDNLPLCAYTNLDRIRTNQFNKFDILISGINIYDNINNPELISGLVTSNFEKYKTSVISEDYSISHGTFSHNATAMSGILANYLPPDLIFITIS